MVAVTMETGATEEAAGVSIRPVRAGLITPCKKTRKDLQLLSAVVLAYTAAGYSFSKYMNVPCLNLKHTHTHVHTHTHTHIFTHLLTVPLRETHRINHSKVTTCNCVNWFALNL